MKRALVAGLVGLMSGAGLLVPHLAHAAGAPVPYTGSCPGGGPAVLTNGSPQVWVCFSNATVGGATGFYGGAVGVGVTTTNGPTRLCPTNTSVNNPVGVYAIADGDDANTVGASRGYIGVSNYESGGSDENCVQSNNGAAGSSNSGGSFGLDALPGDELPLPIVCGFTSGPDFGSTGRDGCYLP